MDFRFKIVNLRFQILDSSGFQILDFIFQIFYFRFQRNFRFWIFDFSGFKVSGPDFMFWKILDFRFQCISDFGFSISDFGRFLVSYLKFFISVFRMPDF